MSEDYAYLFDKSERSLTEDEAFDLLAWSESAPIAELRRSLEMFERCVSSVDTQCLKAQNIKLLRISLDLIRATLTDLDTGSSFPLD